MVNSRKLATSAATQEIPEKIYYSISEVSEYTGVEPHVLRYWETKFGKLNPKRVGGNQRKYTRNDLKLIFDIIHLLYQEGYTLDGAERKLRGGYTAEAEAQPSRRENGGKVAQLPTGTRDPRAEANAQVMEELASIKAELKEILALLG